MRQSIYIFGTGICLACSLILACAPDSKTKNPKKSSHSQRDQASQTMALDLTSEAAISTLYPFGMAAQNERSVSGIALEGDAEAVRIYTVHRGLLPSQSDAIPLYSSQVSESTVNPAAAAILAESSTRLIFYARRGAMGLQFPMGWGLPLRTDEVLVAEVEWSTSGSRRHILVDVVDQALKPIIPWVAETTSRRMLDAPTHLTTSTTIPSGQQIFWVSLIASESLAPQSLHLGGVAVPLHFGTTPLHDFFVPANGKASAKAQSVELACATRAATDTRTVADCGVFGYYYQP